MDGRSMLFELFFKYEGKMERPKTPTDLSLALLARMFVSLIVAIFWMLLVHLSGVTQGTLHTFICMPPPIIFYIWLTYFSKYKV
jgi:hypothetical protein